MINVLIVDDSPVFRMLFRLALEKDPELKVIGEAINGEDAVVMAAQLSPDIITMDINMPGIGGYEAITRIMDQSPCPIVALTGIDSQDLIAASFKDLALGALTILPKPAGIISRNPDMANIIRQMKTLASIKVRKRTSKPSPTQELLALDKKLSPPVVEFLPWTWTKAPKLVAVGVSTGGPPALHILLKSLPANFPLPLVIVQHISAGFVDSLAKWLTDTTSFPCKVAEQNEHIKSGIAYLAADNHHLEITPSGKVSLTDADPIANLRPAAEALFLSIAKNFGPQAIGVELTGMGRDGANGLLCMRNAGAYTIAQDERSSAIFGMPREAIHLGAAREVLSIDHIGPRLIMLLHSLP